MLEATAASRLSRRLFLRVAGLSAVLTATSSLLAACGGDDDSPATATSAGAAAPTSAAATTPASDAPATPTENATAGGEPVQGGNLRFTHESLLESLDSNMFTSRFIARVAHQIFDTVIAQPESGEFVPLLAESWEISDDGLQVTLHLREGVTFHDGNPFNAEALKASFDRIAAPDSTSLRTELDFYDHGEVIDEYTITLHLTQMSVAFLDGLTTPGTGPSSIAAVEELGDDYSRHPVGTGPFRVKEWQGENVVILERFPEYNWGPAFLDNQGPAYLETITYTFVEEATTRLVTLESDDADIIDGPPSIEVERLTDSDRYQVHVVVPPGMPESCLINVSVPPTDDVAVRQAILYAVDREAGARLIHHGALPPAYGPLTSSSWAYWDGVEEMYQPDLDRANQILDEAGWQVGSDGIRERDGQRLQVRHVTTSGPALQIAEFIQASVRDAGIDYVVEGMEFAATRVRMEANDYEVGRLGLASPDPHYAMYATWHSSQVTGGESVTQFNRARVQNDRLDELILAGNATNDIDERRDIYREMQQIIMDQAYIIPNWEVTLYHVMQPRVHGLKTNVVGEPYLLNVWLEDA